MRIISSALLVVAFAASDRPHVLLICHNSNCAEPTDPQEDDTISAMNKSLALTVEGKPAIDGLEVDLFWRASDDTCIFAHDLETAGTDLATQAADAVAFHITTAPQLTFGGGNFQMFVELKDSGRLSSSHEAAARVLAWLARPDFGTAPVADVRDP